VDLFFSYNKAFAYVIVKLSKYINLSLFTVEKIIYDSGVGTVLHDSIMLPCINTLICPWHVHYQPTNHIVNLS
jgi:hypothetical protein